MDSWKIVRVSEDFRVIALGLPVPKYKGNPLDPPLRSRFQARDIYYLPFKVSVGINRLSIIKNFPPPECLNKERKGLDLTLNWSCFYYPEIHITHCKQTLLSPPGLSLKGIIRLLCVYLSAVTVFFLHIYDCILKDLSWLQWFTIFENLFYWPTLILPLNADCSLFLSSQ